MEGALRFVAFYPQGRSGRCMMPQTAHDLPPTQANLGLRRVKQCDEFLALASLLVTQHAEDVTHAMRSQLNRCYGQMYASQVHD